jgi:flagellum-specific ATP synthase
VQTGNALEVRGTLTRLTGLVLEASGHAGSGGLPMPGIHAGTGAGFGRGGGLLHDRAFLMPAGDVHGLSSGASVEPAPAYVPVPRWVSVVKQDRPGCQGVLRLPLGDGLLGRVVDAHGHPMDRMGPILEVASLPLDRKPINAMDRAPVREPLDTGIRAINALLTVGRGQRWACLPGPVSARACCWA